jgi:hypothetical protein
MAASTPAQGSSAWGSAVILVGLPSISGRGDDGALEGPGSVEAAPFSPLARGLLSSQAARPSWPRAPLVWWWCWLSWGQ